MSERSEDIELSVLCVAETGLPVRGVSPYSDHLVRALQHEAAESGSRLFVMDFAAAMPGALHPGGSLLKAKRKGVSWWSPLSWLRVAASPVEVVHLQYWNVALSSYFVWIVFLCRILGRKVVLTLHNPEPHERFQIFRFTEWLLLRLVDGLIVHGAVGHQVVKSRLGGASARRIFQIPHGVEVSSEAELGRDESCHLLGLDPELRYVCVFGNLRGYKGIDVLLTAWRAIEQRSPNVVLVLAGRLWGNATGLKGVVGSALGFRKEAQRILGMLSALEDPSRVKLIDRFLGDEEIDALLSLSEFAIFPYTRFASQSGAASRAAGRGCPILVADVGELPCLAISDDWIVPPGNAMALADAIEKHLSRIHKVGEEQKRRAALFSWTNVARLHLEAYSRVAKRLVSEG